MMESSDENITCPVREAALRSPESPAITSITSTSGKTLTYRDLDGMVGAASSVLREHKLAGERVGIYTEKSAEQIALVFGLIRSGSVAVMIPTRMPPRSVPELLRCAGCVALVSAEPEAAAPELPILAPEEFSGSVSEPEDPEVRPSQPATVVFTSGSTGAPKAALHTLGNHLASATGSGQNIALSAGDVWLHSLPLFHVGGLSILFRCVLAGAAIALPERGDGTAKSALNSGATHLSLVATQLARLLDENADLSGVKAILLGGSGIPEELTSRALKAGLPVHKSYGLTEMSSQVTTTSPGAGVGELATSGRVLPGREVGISCNGEILVRGATLFSGYITPEGLSSPTDDDGWFHTRDLGYTDGRGFLSVTGRLDNQFISGGENIQPEEIEDALRRMAGVADAVVVPVPDPEFGERPVAFVKGEMPRDAASELRRTLPGFKVPLAFYEWPDDAPEGMKVDRGFFRGRAGEFAESP